MTDLYIDSGVVGIRGDISNIRVGDFSYRTQECIAAPNFLVACMREHPIFQVKIQWQYKLAS